MQNEKLAYSIKAAVEATSYSRSHLYQLISQGELKIYRRGGRVFIAGDELRRLILEDSQKGGS